MAKMESGSGSDTGLIALLIQINKALHRRTSEELLGMRLKPFLLLGYVRDRGAVSQQELETGLLMDANSVVLLLNETEAAGFSVRRRDPADRRRHMVELTDAGRVAVERAEKAREGIEDEVLSDLSVDERKALRKLLKRVLEGLLQGPRRIPLAGLARRILSRRSLRRLSVGKPTKRYLPLGVAATGLHSPVCVARGRALVKPLHDHCHPLHPTKSSISRGPRSRSLVD